MKATSIIRCLAYAVAVTAALDPPLRSNRLVPIAVSLREPNGALALNVPMADQAGAVRAALESAMPGDVAINTTAEPQGFGSKRQLSLSLVPFRSCFHRTCKAQQCGSCRSPALGRFCPAGLRLSQRTSKVVT